MTRSRVKTKRSLRLKKSMIKEFQHSMQEARGIMKICGVTNPPKEHVVVLAAAMELNKVLLRPIPDVEPIGGPVKCVFWPDGLN